MAAWPLTQTYCTCGKLQQPLHGISHRLLPGSRPGGLLPQISGERETLHQGLLLASLQGTGTIQPWVPGLISLKDGDDSAKQQKNAEITPVQVRPSRAT